MFWWPCPSWPHLGFVHPLLCCFLLGYWFCPARHCCFLSYILSLSCSLAFPCRTILLARSSNFSILLGFFRLFLSPHYCQDWSKVFKNIYLLQFNSVFPVPTLYISYDQSLFWFFFYSCALQRRFPFCQSVTYMSHGGPSLQPHSAYHFWRERVLVQSPMKPFFNFRAVCYTCFSPHSCLGISNHFSY